MILERIGINHNNAANNKPIIVAKRKQSITSYKVIEENLEFIRLRHPTDLNTGGMSVAETYVVQFLRRYLNNCFGFLEGQAVQFMVENQKSLNIKLRKVTQGPAAFGQGAYPNYHIEYI